MKTLPVFTAALGVTFLLYALYKKLRFAANNKSVDEITAPASRHITDVFAKAKQVATPGEGITGEPVE